VYLVHQVPGDVDDCDDDMIAGQAKRKISF